MNHSVLTITNSNNILSLKFQGKFDLYTISRYEKQIKDVDLTTIREISIDLNELTSIDTAASIFLNNLQSLSILKNINVSLQCRSKDILDSLEFVKHQKEHSAHVIHKPPVNVIDYIGEKTYSNYLGFLAFMAFIGELFATKFHYIKKVQNIRFKEIAFEINESGIKALGIIALSAFLIGVVVAYQSAYQLKIYGANIFIVDMLGISLLRELAPLITAIVIAGRSASAFTAQIGAMKITEELDAMKTMGFDPYVFLLVPKIVALMIVMPILIFVADMMGIIGGMIVANLDLSISTELFLDRFNEVIAVKHFFIGIAKGPFFAFLIATIGIYRGLKVKNDTQSIGFNTTKSVVEAIFAVIVCDAIFSIVLTNMGI